MSEHVCGGHVVSAAAKRMWRTSRRMWGKFVFGISWNSGYFQQFHARRLFDDVRCAPVSTNTIEAVAIFVEVNETLLLVDETGCGKNFVL